MKKYLPGLLIIIPAVFLFKMIFFGEIVTTNDELARHPINQWTETYLHENKGMPQWYPNLFSGMPSYGGYIYMTGDPTKSIRNTILFNPGLKIWFFLSLAGFGTFFIMKLLGASTISSVITGLMTSLTPYHFGLINAGHLTKIFAIAYAPWVLAAVIYFMKKKSLKSICFLSLATAVQLWANHPQIVYYTWMVIGFYFFWIIGNAFRNNIFSSSLFSMQLAGVLCSIFIALLMVSDPYMDIYTFQKHSNRGAKSVLDNTEQTSTGTNWKYATQWSFHPKETVSFLYPYFYGLQNFSSRDLKSAAYWGYMPFTQSTHYLGLIALILASIGALLKKPDKISLFFWITTILILITGFGKFFPLLYKPFFELFPFFSKFRIPSMIYALLPITISILAAKGYDIMISSKGEKHIFKKAFYFVGGIVAVSFLFLIVSDFMIDFSSSKDGRYNLSIQGQLRSLRYDLFNKGCFLTITVSLCFLGLYYSYIKNKISESIFSFGVIGLIILDLGVLNNEFINVKPKKNMDAMFKKNSTIDHLISDNSNFRIFPADEITSNKYSYWNIESIGGYRPIKLRSYQDLIDAGGFNRTHVLDMLNVKYVLTRKKIENPSFIPVKNLKGIYENKKVLPKAWIIGNLKKVKSQKESLMETLMTGFNPYTSAVVLKYEGSDMPANANGQVTVKLKEENKIEINCQSETGGLLVLSEIYYKPGWKAFVNGLETKIYQTNHVLRSVYIPAGNSEVLFEYDKSSWEEARILSRISLLIVFMFIGFAISKERRSKNI